MHVPRFTPRGLAASAVIVAVCGLLASCSSGGSQNAQTTKSPTATVQAEATPAQTFSPATSVPTGVGTAPAVTPTFTAADFSAIKTVAKYRKDAAPASTDLSGSVNVDGYLQTVLQSNRTIWGEVFQGTSVSMPTLTYDITSRSDRYTSACTRNGEPIVVTPTYGKLFYCSADNKPYGAIALPTGVITPVWKKTSRPLADLAVAISTSRQASLLILDSLQAQLNLPKPGDIGRQYTALCMAGVWSHAVYAQNAFTDKDLSTALYQSLSIPSEVNGTVTSPSASDQQAITAWIVGFRGGDPSECGLHFWQ